MFIEDVETIFTIKRGQDKADQPPYRTREIVLLRMCNA